MITTTSAHSKRLVKTFNRTTIPKRLEDILTKREQSVVNGIIEGTTNAQGMP